MSSFFRGFGGFGGNRGGPARSNLYTLQAYPRLIEPESPDYARCVPEFGRELTKRDCKEAVKNMPWLRQSAEVDWAVNFHAQQYNLPMSIGWTVPKGEAGNCVISIEVAGPQAFYDRQTTNTPFTIRASPFQLRGLAAYVVNDCVQQGGNVGGFATNKISNLANYLRDPNTDLSLPYPISAHFLTVSVKGRTFGDPQPGNTHPSVAVLIAEYLSGILKGADNAVRAKLGSTINRMVVVSQKMRPGGNTPWWQQIPESADEMTYECDAKLGAPAAVDCEKVEYGELGADDDTISVGAGVVKFLSSGTCQVAITAATTITLNWRQIRTALDTLFNICVNPPIYAGTGGKAYFGPQPVVSRRSLWGKRQDDDDLSGLNALPPGGNITVSSVPLRPPERMLGVNSTLAANSTMLVNATYAIPAL
ncbi:MAG: hypothetical protein ALECFALPRED_004349 [Alectoria fallacina]|uniref:Uncharacterized protein n=1 Tax=Alectoria fallacina TaxID=1903189 RepID=A0A8H3EPL8_9LECA|nr:MAG: hypothetical protein ALECFALPRED_004349 [Alectoria fallacina]